MRGLTHKEFNALLKEMHEKHELVTGRCMKYLDLSYDFRTHEIWRIVMRPFCTEKVFTTANRSLDEVPSQFDCLYDEIKEWLDNGLKEQE